MNKLQKHYDKLSDLERFRLALAAIERDDEAELRALRETAPRATYKMTKWEYRVMFDAIQFVAWYAVNEVQKAGVLLAFAWGEWRAGEERHERDPDIPPAVERATTAANAIIATWDALALFCEELGVTRDQALVHVPPGSTPFIVEFALSVLPLLEEDFSYWLATEKLGYEGEELYAAMEKRDANLTERRRADAERVAAQMRQIWEAR